jgi:hypothetical protein
MIRIAIVFSMAVIIFGVSAQEQVSTFDGAEITGYFLRGTDTSLVLSSSVGIEYTILKNRISNKKSLKSIIITNMGIEITCYISRLDSAKIYFYENKTGERQIMLSDVKKYFIADELYFGYKSSGYTLGTPAAINYLFSYHFQGLFYLKFQAGTILIINGIELDGGINLNKTKNFEHNISAAIGLENLGLRWLLGTGKDQSFTYWGLSYDLNWGGFYLNLGFAICDTDYPEALPIFQIGYVYRLLD